MWPITKARIVFFFSVLLMYYNSIAVFIDLSEICYLQVSQEQEERIHFPLVLSHFQHSWNVKHTSKLHDYVRGILNINIFHLLFLSPTVCSNVN